MSVTRGRQYENGPLEPVPGVHSPDAAVLSDDGPFRSGCHGDGETITETALPRPAQVMVLHIQWTQDGTARQETYGPWTADDDLSHMQQIAAFLRDWQRLTGCAPSAATLAIVMDPGAWMRQHPSA